jgi:uncharacterized protein YdeI (YjbR/CyaY-like superfamily)
VKPIFFATQAELRKWFNKNHKTAEELLLGYYKVGSGQPSVTWPQSVDEALCFGWIDGVRRSIDAESYTIRFTPRRTRSIWSAVNIKRAGELKELGLMKPAGLKAFEGRDPQRAQLYSSEQRTVAWPPALEKQFKRNKAAWEFFGKQPPSYRKTIGWWVVSAKKEETQQKRLARLTEASAASQRIDLLDPYGNGKYKEAEMADFTKLTRKRQAMPADVSAALTKRGLMAAYKLRPAYQQNDYLAWIGRAVRPATRQKRLEQMLNELERGGVYMNMKWNPK